MKKHYLLIIIPLLLLTACGPNSVQQIILTTDKSTLIASSWARTPTLTNSPTSTKIITPTPTEISAHTSTLTPTIPLTPTKTNTPKPVSLSGVIFLSEQPFITIIELWHKGLVGIVETSPDGSYAFDEVLPGRYEFRILITKKDEMVAGCNDIYLPKGKWRMGIRFEDNKSITMEYPSLSMALELYENIDSPTLNAIGFYAVLSEYEVESEIKNSSDEMKPGNKMEIDNRNDLDFVFICK